MNLLRFLLLLLLAAHPLTAAEPPGILERRNLVAWCIVPFDAKKRGPEERAAMLEKMGLQRLAYDYRPEHIPQFDAEMGALKKHGIELTAWWFPGAMNDEARLILDVIKRHGVKPQLWITGGGESPKDAAARIEEEAARLRPICQAAAALDLKVALYNHGGWFGEPENQIAIIERLKRDGITNCGIVYNQHHGHGHVDRFPALLEKMKPYLLALNLNGIIRDGEAKGQKIVPLAQGELDADLLRTIIKSGWRGPVGVLNHTDEDAEARLLDNLDGLDWLLKELAQPGSAGAKPTPRSWKAPVPPAAPKQTQGADGRKCWEVAFGQNPPSGLVVEGAAWREVPVTVEVRAQLNSKTQFNILAAADPKSSAWHWELYSFAGTGTFCAYLPGRGGNFDTGVPVTDGQSHDIAAIIEPQRLRLFVDGQLKKEAALAAPGSPATGGGFALGQLVESVIGCDGRIERARVRRGVQEITAQEWKPDDADTLGLWEFALPPQAPAPAKFPCEAAPLVPEQWPNRTHPVNRDRVFDFYAKQARHFMQQKPAPPLLAPFPDLDGGTHGHWGNQNENTWRDGRLNQMDCGPCVAGVFRGAGLTIPKAVCVQLGDNGERSACFDPDREEWKVLWQGGFVKFTDTRHGLMDGLSMDGQPLQDELTVPVPGKRASTHFRGYYRHGKRTVFSYAFPGGELLQSVQFENGKVKRENGEALRSLTKGGPAQWPQVLETQGTPGKPIPGWPYVVDTLTLPFDDPWRTLFFIGGHDFFSNGDIALCTMTGDVWRVSGVDAALSKLRWKRIAGGLHQPLGLVVVDDKVCVLGRDQITRLHDLNGDGESDFYECLTNSYTTPTGGHDYICGLERDAAGNFYTVSSKDGLMRLKPGEKPEVLATGFRNPDGLGLAPDGTLTVPLSEGEWSPASGIVQITKGGYYGYPGPRPGAATLPPLLYLPRGLDNSSGGQAWVPDDRWGPLRGRMIHLSYGAGTHHLVLRQQVNGVWQGAAVPLPGDFAAGVHRARFSPHDGQLYVSGMTGWGTYTPADGCLQRVRYTGGPGQVPVAFEARDNGVLLTFSQPLDASAAIAAQHFAQCWAYHYSQGYGSPEYSLRWPATPGHDVLEITSAHILPDGRRLFLEIPQLQPAPQIHLLVQPQPGVWRELFLTAHNLAPPFTDFAGYQVIAKTSWTAPAAPVISARANPFTTGKSGRAVCVEAAAGLQFATKELTAHAGERLSLTFANPDVLPHNWVLLAPGSFEKVGDLANKLIADPQGAAQHYVPDIPEVLAWTGMVSPGDSATIHFNAPAQPGEHPYICTFPGHWMVMKGLLHVE